MQAASKLYALQGRRTEETGICKSGEIFVGNVVNANDQSRRPAFNPRIAPVRGLFAAINTAGVTGFLNGYFF